MKRLSFKPGDKITNSVGVLEFVEDVIFDNPKKKQSYGQWKCFCGKLFVIANWVINTHTTKSCGCWEIKCQQNKIKDPNTIYLYLLWGHINNRSYDKDYPGLSSYDRNKITIYDDWKFDSNKFINDILLEIGHRTTPKHQLDRINVRGNYEPGNIRWATAKENCRNKTNNVFITINNETKTLIEWSELSGISGNTIIARQKRGWIEQKLLDPIKILKKSGALYLYGIFNNIKCRCYNKNSLSFVNYGAKGIEIYSEWKDNFKEFEKYIFENLGHRPTDKHQLDRYPNKYGNYEPGNLRWATSEENNRNKTNNKLIIINGIEKTLMEWSEISGIRRGTISDRVENNWPESEILSPSIKKKISDSDVDIIREDVKNGSKMGAIAKKYGVRHAVIADVIHCRGAYEKK